MTDNDLTPFEIPVPEGEVAKHLWHEGQKRAEQHELYEMVTHPDSLPKDN